MLKSNHQDCAVGDWFPGTLPRDGERMRCFPLRSTRDDQPDQVHIAFFKPWKTNGLKCLWLRIE
jgi:hypothetical protein